MSDDNSILDFYSRQLAMIEATAGGVVIGDRRVVKMPGDGEPSYPIGLSMPMSWDLPKPDPVDFVVRQQLGGLVQRVPMQIIRFDWPMPRAPGVDAMLADDWVWTGWRFARDEKPAKEWTDVAVVPVEGTPIGSEVFIRVGPEGSYRVGMYRGDAADGEAKLVEGMQWVGEVTPGEGVWREVYGTEARGEGEQILRGKIGKRSTVRPGRYAGHITDRPVLAGRYADRLPTNRRRKRERAKVRRRERTIR